MVDAVDSIESWVGLVIFFAAAAFELFALVDAAIRPARSFVAMDKLSKPAWILILALALLTCIAFRSPIGIFGLLGVLAASVYMADVRPAISARRGHR
ncbi:MAG TPA: DUF2516 family protein [Marmoricola sp.]|nr:DUF2516 family protein [Marmoricola sp.]